MDLGVVVSNEGFCGLIFNDVFLGGGVKHSGPTKLVLYFTGATNILYTFGGHAVTV